MIPWIIISIIILIIIVTLALIFLMKNKGKKQEPDYYTFFIMGIIWLSFGIIFWSDMPFFFIMGLVFMTLGLANKDKWKNHKNFRKMNSSERKILLWILLTIGLIILLGLLFFFLVNKGII